MHRVVTENNIRKLKGCDIEEMCPYCGEYVGVKLDPRDKSYSVTCPDCGEKVMLCTACHDDFGGVCDWSEENGCFCSRGELLKRITQDRDISYKGYRLDFVPYMSAYRMYRDTETDRSQTIAYVDLVGLGRAKRWIDAQVAEEEKQI